MRTQHHILDASDFGAKRWLCHCGHWSWTGSHMTADGDVEALWAEHVALWNQAGAELDEVER